MVSAKEFVWNRIIDSEMNVETFRQCYVAMSLMIPNDWQAVPIELLNIFSKLVNTLESRQIRNLYGVAFYQIDTFSIWLIKSGHAVAKDIESWISIREIRKGINDTRVLFDAEGNVEPNNLLRLYNYKTDTVKELQKYYKDGTTLATVTLNDGRVLPVTDDWYI